ncbi:helix-turn-helix domain-containing protein [Mycobacterium sp. 1245852.3]|uniref:helix-turn-helix domain-containing protein n=1 Tax=Mycobacterium sp. 1245852.3 TaxID=1856860 RepID=UPI000A484D0E
MPLLRISEVADELRVSPRIVQKWIHDGQLPARRFGSRVVRVDRSDLDAFGRAAVDVA